MEWKLEVIPVPVTDVDRAKRFYTEDVGFACDADERLGDAYRMVQLTPPGSGCSIVIGDGMTEMNPGTLDGLQLCVGDIEAARAELVSRGVEVSPVQHYDTDTGELLDGPAEEWNRFVFFTDPDGNKWVVQESPRITG
ncbi:putative enzyme related to lactoylglutathione lyase [Nocardiopsis mwathae]|uniref:Putative enzyme related to lactoylglutathione lyase n=1 Tax=Nocardiopsis mwathae TaxID=1472723 RepID=A0A7X0D409_9ACTN|nr:VOC family protein [Nocardiopsis mwathae]MBB6170570.1 putative enzyme related to lactoylglutathione lyase [Nocardiopsis mwathae]